MTLHIPRILICLLFLGAACSDGGSSDPTSTPTPAASPDPTPTPSPCGNGRVDAGETCDGDDLGGMGCRSLDFAAGELRCGDDCQLDTSACVAAVCGDGSQDGDEACDGADLGAADCLSEGFLAGTLRCRPDCTLDTSSCEAFICGNSNVERAGEHCDGDALDGASCESLGFVSGQLACREDCLFDTGACVLGPACPSVDLGGRVGPGVFIGSTLDAGDDQDAPECASFPSDGEDLALAWTAPSTGRYYLSTDGSAVENYLSVRIGCDGEEVACSALPRGPALFLDAVVDTQYVIVLESTAGSGEVALGIFPPTECGNGTRDFPELCDGEDVGAVDCVRFGLEGGALRCNDSCDGYDVSGCTGPANCPHKVLGEVQGLAVAEGLPRENENYFTASCAPPGEDYDEEVLLWTVPDAGTWVIDTAGSGNETMLYARAGDCYGPELGCSDWGDGRGLTLRDLEAGQVIALFVESFGNAGDYELNIQRAVCGDGRVLLGEICDTTNLKGESCESMGYLSGDLACNAECSDWDFSACVPPTCGDGVAEGFEACDGEDLKGASCLGLGAAGGTLRCADDCRELDGSGCLGCGDRVKNGREQCDREDFGGATCESLGLGQGELQCDPFLCFLNTSGCSGEAVCGDGVLQHPETCDGEARADSSCQDFGYESGTLGCTNCQLDIAGCSGGRGALTCGNGRRDPDEACDAGEHIFGDQCINYVPGLMGGDVGCRDDCYLDFSACDVTDVCAAAGLYGDGRICDPCELMGGTEDADCELCGVADGVCPSINAAGGVTCRRIGKPDPDCDPCGNGVRGALAPLNGIDIDIEACDGPDVGLQTCQSLGYSDGLLRCLPTCELDVSQCVP